MHHVMADDDVVTHSKGYDVRLICLSVCLSMV